MAQTVENCREKDHNGWKWSKLADETSQNLFKKYPDMIHQDVDPENEISGAGKNCAISDLRIFVAHNSHIWLIP